MYDIVYVLKNSVVPNEIRYSLRSVEKNFPYNKIWFYGGKPGGIEPDYYVSHRQEGLSKYSRAIKTWEQVVNNNNITEDFWVFNDDFFILNKVSECPPMYYGDLMDYALRIERKHGTSSKYTLLLRNTYDYLKSKGYSTLNYELHVPMLVNREKLKPLLNETVLFRSVYGNTYSIGGIEVPDVKIFGRRESVNSNIHHTFLSTSDKSYNEGLIGDYVRNYFSTPSKYEVR